MRITISSVATAAIIALSASVANAQLVIYNGFDLGSQVVGLNSGGARNAFLAATGGAVKIDFESAYPAGVAVSGTGYLNSTLLGTVALYGGNTTPGGKTWLQLYAGTATFTFTGGANYWGAFLSGNQLSTNTITFNNGSSQTFTPDFDLNNGGMAFWGFTDFSHSVASVTVTVGDGRAGDITGVDDVIYGTKTVVPEPGTYGMLMAGLGALAFAARRRRTA